jgi:hypothetical protein
MPEACTPCQTCGAKIPASSKCRDMYNELSLYTLTLHDPGFIHQYAVDAYAAQHAQENTKPIATTAALIGLYLFAERNYSGKKVQQVHMILGNKMKEWPPFEPPKEKATLTVTDALKAEAGPGRDEMIRQWAKSVWNIWKLEHAKIEKLLKPIIE